MKPHHAEAGQLVEYTIDGKKKVQALSGPARQLPDRTWVLDIPGETRPIPVSKCKKINIRPA